MNDTLTAEGIFYWVLFALGCSLFFGFLRWRLRQRNRMIGYPYSIYRLKKRRLRRLYLRTLGFAALGTLSAVTLLQLANSH